MARLRNGLAVACVASIALAMGGGGGPRHAEDETGQSAPLAMALGGPSDLFQNDTAPGGAGGGSGAGGGGVGSAAFGATVFNAFHDGLHDLESAEGEGSGSHDSGDGDGFAPNGENGLMLLADYVAGAGEGRQPAAAPLWGDAPAEGEPVLPGVDSVQVAENDTTTGGGLGFGGAGGGGGGGGGGSGGGGGGGGEPGDPVSKPGPDDGPPAQTPPPTVPPIPGDEDPAPVCLLSTGCDLAPPPATPPRTFVPGGGDPPIGLPPPSDPPRVEVAPVPEPATWLMLVGGFMGLGAALRIQRRRATLA